MSVDAVKNIEDLAQFVEDSPVSYLAARTVARRLQGAGFTELTESETWPDSAATGRHFVVRDGAIIAWAGGRQASAASGYRVLGAHTDSPALKVKPKSSLTVKGWHQIGVENYGGGLLNSYLDRELRLAGRLTVHEGGTLRDRYVCTPPLARIPQLAPHLDHKRNELVLINSSTCTRFGALTRGRTTCSHTWGGTRSMRAATLTPPPWSATTC